MKLNLPLFAFCIIYYLITFALISGMQSDQSASLGYILFFPIFWILSGFILWGLFRAKKIAAKSIIDKSILFLSTPAPLILFFIFSSFLTQNLNTSTEEYNKNGHRYRIIRYNFGTSGKNERVEFYKSIDTVSEQNPFPQSDTWAKDSIWIYYNKDGSIKKKEDYTNK